MDAKEYARLAVLLLAAGLLAACSGIKTYPNTLDKNLNIRTDTRSKEFLGKVKADVDIYRVDANCEGEYLGTVKLGEATVAVGIPPDRPSYLVFNFASSAFFSSSSSSINYATLLKPRSGYRYDIQVSYIDNIYDVAIRETHPRRGAGREIERRPLRACKTY
ncbi:MAG: hypothetical protein OEY27_02785 [Gammaproteobacteria bacterium]|nr:hypothetical protein [Gammaproteobacteria bacterium]